MIIVKHFFKIDENTVKIIKKDIDDNIHSRTIIVKKGKNQYDLAEIINGETFIKRVNFEEIYSRYRFKPDVILKRQVTETILDF